jgi:glycosyltransferase involved in cell wall biosynthesis
MKDPSPGVLLLVTTFDVGGAERVLVELAAGLRARGYRVLAVCLQRRSGSIGRELEDAGATVFDLRMRGKWDLRVLWKLVAMLRAKQIDVLYTFLYHASVLGRIAGKLAGTPVILSSQQTMVWQPALGRLANRLTAAACTRVVAVSDSVADYLVDTVGVRRDRVVTIPNSVDTSSFSPTRTESSEPVAGMIARLTPEKDHQTLIAAFAEVRNRWRQARLVFAGEGPERPSIEHAIHNTGIADAVTLLGHVDDVRPVLAQLSVYVQSTHVEGMPVAVLEAMAAGLPVIATRVGGNTDAVVDGRTGLLVPPNDVGAMAEALDSLFSDPDRRAEMGAEGQKRVAAAFSTQAMVAATDALMRSLLKRHVNVRREARPQEP